MKTQPTARRLANRNHRGFALIITLTLMVLMTIIALGLFSLSSVSLRAASQSKAQEMAKANARMALNIAIGELQKYAGPDQRITATGSIMDDATTATPNEMANIAGVWESWKIDPNSLPAAADYKKDGTRKSAPLNNNSPNDGNFCKWLVSTEDPAATDNVNFVKNPSQSITKKITLLPAISSGSTSMPEIYAGLIPIKDTASGKESGGYAWAVMDEGVKARMDTGHEPGTGNKLGDLSAALGSGARADVSKINTLKGIDWKATDLSKKSDIQKAISFDSSALFNESLSGPRDFAFKSLFNDVTVHSLGLFTDVVDGGLKKDMSALVNASTESTLPSGYNSKGIYETELGYLTPKQSEINSTVNANGSGIIDPRWITLYRYSNLFRSPNSDRIPANGNIPMKTPTAWAGTLADKAPPLSSVGPNLMPIISKAQIFFSVAPVQDSATSPTYVTLLFYTPIITLYNPYNVPVTLTKAQVEINNPPLAVSVRKNAEAFSNWKAMQYCYQGSGATGHNKKFRMLSIGENYVMQPGEISVFSPVIDPLIDFRTDQGAGTANRVFIDNTDSNSPAAQDMTIRNRKFDKGIRGVNVGYCLDWIRKDTSPDFKLKVALSDTIQVKFRPASFAGASGGARSINGTNYTFPAPGIFNVILSNEGGASTYASLNFDFRSQVEASTNLMVGLEKSIQFPSAGLTFPPDSSLSVQTVARSFIAPLKDYNPIGCFAVLTATAKTSLANSDNNSNPENDDGRFTSKPWAFDAPTSPYLNVRLDSTNTSIHPAQYPYDLDLFPIYAGGGYGADTYLDTSTGGTNGFGLTGQRTSTGSNFGTLYEVPQSPLQTLPELNNANLASSGQLDRFLYPVGNSYAHPNINASAIKRTDPSGTGAAPLFDHSFLLNLALYDRYYFSGIAAHEGSFMTSKSITSMADDFVDSNIQSGSGSVVKNPLYDKRMSLWLSPGETATIAKTALSSSGLKNASGYQMMKGAFNVNSTSKDAWKAMLASMNVDNANINPTSGGSGTLSARTTKTFMFSRFRVPNDNIGTTLKSRLQAPRELTDSQLDTLAGEIVKQVKTRGPFLSMAEFVNRQIGTSSLSTKGALQEAIDNTDINSNAGSPGASTTGYDITAAHVAAYRYANPDAALGRTDQGAPNNLTQADLMSILGNAATVRSDTFRVRAYGEAKDSYGKVIARAWCEAIVQRSPDFVSNSDNKSLMPSTPTTGINDVLTSNQNKKFGRKLVIFGFRWIPMDELNS